MAYTRYVVFTLQVRDDCMALRGISLLLRGNYVAVRGAHGQFLGGFTWQVREYCVALRQLRGSYEAGCLRGVYDPVNIKLNLINLLRDAYA